MVACYMYIDHTIRYFMVLIIKTKCHHFNHCHFRVCAFHNRTQVSIVLCSHCYMILCHMYVEKRWFKEKWSLCITVCHVLGVMKFIVFWHETEIIGLQHCSTFLGSLVWRTWYSTKVTMNGIQKTLQMIL